LIAVKHGAHGGRGAMLRQKTTGLLAQQLLLVRELKIHRNRSVENSG
jgi:hypothetical protein